MKPSQRDLYGEIREMILNFDLAPGSRVTETELASHFDVSRTPVRGALQRLQAEGYLTVLPKQGCFIREIDVEYLSQIYQVRIALEMLSLEGACTHMRDVRLKVLAAEWNPDRDIDNAADPSEMEARDEAFHVTLAEGSGNLALAHYLDDINLHIRVIRRLDFTDPGRVDKTYDEHYRICRYLLRRDLTKAQVLMRGHIQRSENFAKTLTLTQLARRASRRAKAPFA